MPRLRAWFSRFFGLFQKDKRDAEMAEEMQSHLDLLIERNIAAGMLPHEARNAALRQFGGVEQVKEIAREQRVWRWADPCGTCSQGGHRDAKGAFLRKVRRLLGVERRPCRSATAPRRRCRR